MVTSRNILRNSSFCRIRLMNRDPFTKRRISQNVSTSDHTRSVLKIRLNGYPFSVIGTSPYLIYHKYHSNIYNERGKYVTVRSYEIRTVSKLTKVNLQDRRRGDVPLIILLMNRPFRKSYLRSILLIGERTNTQPLSFKKTFNRPVPLYR